MCPVCMTAMALAAGKVVSAGGIAALVVRKVRPFGRKNADLGLKECAKDGVAERKFPKAA